MPAAQRTVLGVGVFSSASTWVVNVALALLREAGQADATLHFADSWAEWCAAPGDVPLVVKSHHADAAMVAHVAAAGIPVIISLRDPCDATASLIARFGLAPDDAANRVIGSYAACARALAAPRHLVLRYEDGVLGALPGVQRIAAQLRSPVAPARLAEIAEAHAPARIAAHLRALRASGVFDDRPAAVQWEAATHWHPNHVGDGRVGKYAEILSPEIIATLREKTREVAAAFGLDPALAA